MTRRRATAIAEPQATPAPMAPFVLDPNAILFPDQFRQLFRLRADTLRREVRLGRLKVHKRGGRYYLIGSDVMAWIRGGEVKPPGQKAGANGAQPPAEEEGRRT
jgi:hypothetical protein